MDFSKIKEWFIPEGKVVSLSIGGKTVWNEYPTVINAPTVIELDTLNGTNGSHTIRVIDNNPDGITKSYRIYKLCIYREFSFGRGRCLCHSGSYKW